MDLNSSYMFDIYDRMFELPAWKDLIEDLKNRQEGLATQLLYNPQSTEKELYRSQGIIIAYNYLIGLEQSMESAKRQMQEEKELPSINSPSETGV